MAMCRPLVNVSIIQTFLALALAGTLLTVTGEIARVSYQEHFSIFDERTYVGNSLMVETNPRLLVLLVYFSVEEVPIS
jgi:hypothetical protein